MEKLNSECGRTCFNILKSFIVFLFLAFPSAVNGQTGIAVPSMQKADSLVLDFMQTYNIPGATVAIAKNGKLIYNRAFGWADIAASEPMKPYNLLRLASTSKAITSIAIMKLIDNNLVGINDTVFGANRILNQPYYLNAITDNRIYYITIKQLLEHTCGWDRSIGCDGYTGCDPIGFPLHVTSVMGEPNPVGDSTLIKFLLTKGLNHDPGTIYAYSNIGYLVLGKVIEKITGMKYEDYVTSVIMSPLGLCDMHLGRNLLADRQEREGMYNSPYTTLSCYGNNQSVPWQYGGWNLEAMNAHGGWISTSADYVRMILAVDGFATVPDILTPAAITTMTTSSSANAYYAKGWSVNSSGNWWHTGSLDGTSTFMARTSGGYAWAFHFNSRGNSSSAFWNAMDNLPWSCLATATSFPAHNLFSPATAASGLSVIYTGSTSVTLNWLNGSGDKRLILASENNPGPVYPEDGSIYTANNVFGLGQNLGSGVYAVYNGAGNTVNITGLDPAKTYSFTVYEYYDNNVTGNKTVYKYGCRETKSINMATASVVTTRDKTEILLSPNPANDFIRLESGTLQKCMVTIKSLEGKLMMSKEIKGTEVIDISQLIPGMYMVNIKAAGLETSKKLIKY
jgi:CubicO group peptidase (beta-lactamase class C family)